jgi:hypothetical protein
MKKFLNKDEDEVRLGLRGIFCIIAWVVFMVGITIFFAMGVRHSERGINQSIGNSSTTKPSMIYLSPPSNQHSRLKQYVSTGQLFGLTYSMHTQSLNSILTKNSSITYLLTTSLSLLSDQHSYDPNN